MATPAKGAAPAAAAPGKRLSNKTNAAAAAPRTSLSKRASKLAAAVGDDAVPPLEEAPPVPPPPPPKPGFENRTGMALLPLQPLDFQWAPWKDEVGVAKFKNFSTEMTLAFIKPEAVIKGHAHQIQYMIYTNGFVVIASKHVHLTRLRVADFYKEHAGKPYFNGLVRYLSSGPIYVYVLQKEHAVEAWRTLMGPKDSNRARREAPKSIRAIFGLDGRYNAVHGSNSTAHVQKEIRFFFPWPNIPLEPVPKADQCRQFFIQHLQPILVKALTELAKRKPSSDPLEAIEWLATWLQENNPQKPYAAASFASIQSVWDKDVYPRNVTPLSSPL